MIVVSGGDKSKATAGGCGGGGVVFCQQLLLIDKYVGSGRLLNWVDRWSRLIRYVKGGIDVLGCEGWCSLRFLLRLCLAPKKTVFWVLGLKREVRQWNVMCHSPGVWDLDRGRHHQRQERIGFSKKKNGFFLFQKTWFFSAKMRTMQEQALAKLRNEYCGMKWHRRGVHWVVFLGQTMQNSICFENNHNLLFENGELNHQQLLC